MIRAFLAVLAIAPICLAQSTQPVAGTNLVVNGGFETGGWSLSIRSAATGEVTTDAAHDGAQSYKLTNKSGFAPHVYTMISQAIQGLEPFTTYRISCYVKGKNVGLCWIGGGPGWGHRQPFPTGSYDDWKHVETHWTTDSLAGDYQLMICTEGPTEALYVDDVRFEAISADVSKRDAALAARETALRAQHEHFLRVRAALHARPQAARDPVVAMGLEIARRYLDRVSDPRIRQSAPWSTFQLEEVAAVLAETERELANESRRKLPAGAQLHPTRGPVRIRDGTFYADTTLGSDRPWYFYGMGHFGQIFNDLPLWRHLGATMLQDGTVGPNGMNADGSLRDNAKAMLNNLKRAELHGMKVDYLLSPHYFPEWGWNAPGAEGLRGGLGFIEFNIDHPIARDVIGRWTDNISRAMKDRAALLSICLSNEPVYDDSGRDPQSLPLYRQYLKTRHGDIASLNTLYGTSYASFDAIDPPPIGLTSDVAKNRAYFDWCDFNKQHFAAWHAWMRGIIRKNLPDVPTHAKIMVFQTMDRGTLHHGVDPERFCDVTDLAGCDAYAFPDPDYRSYQWHGHEFWYDLLHSFRGQPVFNSENHIIPDGTPAVHIPMTMTRAQFWQGALHHQGVTTTWVWEEANSSSLEGSIYFRPGNAYGAGRAFLDINRVANEVAAINHVRPRIALLYSPASIFWSATYYPTILNTYIQLNFLGEKTTFVSERQLAEQRAAKVDFILVPQATHVTDATVRALAGFTAAGGKVILIGEGNLASDQYARPRQATLARAIQHASPPGGREAAEALHRLLAHNGLRMLDLLDAATGRHAWDVEYRVVDHAGGKLVPMINFAKDAQTVRLPKELSGQAIDLLSGAAIAGDLKLEPMVPMLLRIGGPTP